MSRESEKPRLRVLFIVTAFKRHGQDIITPWMTETVLQLKRRGVDIEVFAPSYKGLGDQVIDGIRIRRFRYFISNWENLTHEQTAPDRVERGLFPKILVPFFLLGGIIGMIRLARSERYDILQAHWPFPCFLFAYVGKLASVPRIISSFHGIEIRWVKKKFPFLKFFLRWMIRKSDALTANTPTTAHDILSIQKAEVEVIPYSVGLKRPLSDVEEEIAVEEDDKDMLLFVGRLVERKGVDYLLRALRNVREKRDARVVLVGDGPEREKLVKLAHDLQIERAVEFAGFISEDRLAKYFRECRIFVLPAVFDQKGDTEGQGVVLVEAMSFKKPVIASNVGGIRDVVTNGETGILVPEKNVESLGEAILRLLDNRDLAREMGLNGFELYRKQYSWDAVSGKWIQLYRSTVGERS